MQQPRAMHHEGRQFYLRLSTKAVLVTSGTDNRLLSGIKFSIENMLVCTLMLLNFIFSAGIDLGRGLDCGVVIIGVAVI